MTESKSIAPHIFNLGTRWRWVVCFTHRLLYPWGKSTRYPFDRRLCGPQRRSRHGGEKKNSHHCPCLIELPWASVYNEPFYKSAGTFNRKYW